MAQNYSKIEAGHKGKRLPMVRRFLRGCRSFQERVTGWRFEPQCLCFYRLPRPPLSYSQFSEDREVVRFFGPAFSGVFMEVGANDGLHGSNSKLLESRGWHGFLVEPIPRLADFCRKS